MKLHPTLPQKMTPENLAQWITQNQIEKRVHIDEEPLTEEQIHEYEKKIATVTAAMYDLAELEKSFKDTIKLGTSMDPNGEDRMPEDFTIPPTKGTKELEANRKHYDGILKRGFFEHPTDVYGIPWPDKDMIVFFDIEGKEYSQYNSLMSEEQKIQFGKLFKDDEGANPLSV